MHDVDMQCEEQMISWQLWSRGSEMKHACTRTTVTHGSTCMRKVGKVINLKEENKGTVRLAPLF